jgi:uncharacterized membrane protein
VRAPTEALDDRVRLFGRPLRICPRDCSRASDGVAMQRSTLEAIFLALFVLASQNRLARQADKRSHLDLQIDLLAEREMTAVLQLLQDIAQHLAVPTTVTSEQRRGLMAKTDLRCLTDRMEELAEPATGATSPTS